MKNAASDSCFVICPYCGAKYQAEAGDFNENERDETCDKCGKDYIRYDVCEVTYQTQTKENDDANES